MLDVAEDFSRTSRIIGSCHHYSLTTLRIWLTLDTVDGRDISLSHILHDETMLSIEICPDGFLVGTEFQKDPIELVMKVPENTDLISLTLTSSPARLRSEMVPGA